VLGLLLEAAKDSPLGYGDDEYQANADIIGRLSDSLKSVFREIF